jgi:hypothetical protein
MRRSKFPELSDFLRVYSPIQDRPLNSPPEIETFPRYHHQSDPLSFKRRPQRRSQDPPRKTQTTSWERQSGDNLVNSLANKLSTTFELQERADPGGKQARFPRFVHMRSSTNSCRRSGACRLIHKSTGQTKKTSILNLSKLTTCTRLT